MNTTTSRQEREQAFVQIASKATVYSENTEMNDWGFVQALSDDELQTRTDEAVRKLKTQQVFGAFGRIFKWTIYICVSIAVIYGIGFAIRHFMR